MFSNRRSMLIVPGQPAGSAPFNGGNGVRPRSAYALGAAAQPDVTGLEYTEDEPHCRVPSVPTSTTPYLPGYHTVRLVGAVYGMATISKKERDSFLKHVGNALEAKSLTHMLYSGRAQATERMIMDCISQGGNAVIGMTFAEADIMGFAQVSVSGTAVYVEKDTPYGAPASPISQ